VFASGVSTSGKPSRKSVSKSFSCSEIEVRKAFANDPFNPLIQQLL
jgi:hypothetical protein